MASRLPRSSLVSSFILAMACAHPRPGGTPPILAPVPGPECKRLGPVSGLATAGDNLGYDQKLYLATQDALAEAKTLGATHVVLDREEGAPSLMRLSGYAYRCP